MRKCYKAPKIELMSLTEQFDTRNPSWLDSLGVIS